MITLSDISKVFPASKAHLLDTRGLIRHEGWTTDGYWLVNTELEPKFLKDLKENDSKPDIQKLIGSLDSVTENNLVEEFKNEFSISNRDILTTLTSKAGITATVNVRYLTLFARLDPMIYNPLFYVTDPIKTVQVRIDTTENGLIGLIMPIKIN